MKKIILVTPPPGLAPDTIAQIKEWWKESNRNIDQLVVVLPEKWTYKIVEGDEIGLELSEPVRQAKQEQAEDRD